VSALSSEYLLICIVEYMACIVTNVGSFARPIVQNQPGLVTNPHYPTIIHPTINKADASDDCWSALSVADPCKPPLDSVAGPLT
jgi:hypothetical protein